MKEIQVHRSAIGRFYAVSFKLSNQGHVSKNQQTKNYQALTILQKVQYFRYDK